MKRKFVIGSLVLLLILIISSYSVFYQSKRPIVQAEKEATIIAEEKAGIQKVDDFYWYNGTDETYFSIAGYDAEDQYIYVVIKQNGANTTILNTSEIVTEDEAKSIAQAEVTPTEVLEARIGVADEEPIWEVSYLDKNGQLGYYILSANTGQLVKEYKNI